MKQHRTYRRHQRGAAAVFVAVSIVTLLIAALLAIEVGRLYFGHRELQRMANLAALDAARVASGCNRDTLPTQNEIDSAVQASLLRNAGSSGVPASNAEVGRITTDRSQGLGSGVSRYLVPVDIADASAMRDAHGVRVTLTQPFPSQLIPLFTPSTGNMVASATAEQTALGSLRIGTTLLSLNDGVVNGLLSALLGGSVSIGAVGYRGIAGVNLTVEQLALALGVDVKDLSDLTALNAHAPILSNVLNNLLGALGTTVSAEVRDSLQNLAGHTTNNTPIPLGAILQPVGAVASGIPFVNLGDLLMALALAANADPSGSATPIAIPGLNLSLLGVNLNVFLQVLEPPQLSPLGRAGLTSVSTAQIRLKTRLQLNTVSDIVAGLNVLLKTIGLGGILYNADIVVDPVRVGIDLDVAPATAYLDRIGCPRVGTNNGKPVANLSAKTGVATLKLGTFLGNASSAPALAQTKAPITAAHIGPVCALLCLIPLGTLSLNVNVTPGPVSVPVGSEAISPLPSPVTQFTRLNNLPAHSTPTYRADGVPPSAAVADNPQTVSSGQLLGSALGGLVSSLNLVVEKDTSQATPGLLDLLSGILAALVNTLVDLVKTALGPVLTGVGGLLDAIIDPLLRLLGIQVGQATVIMDLVTVDQPQIVTTAVPVVIVP
ncbi:pilus assembly protein TadG-related protein [Solimonas variicoloris]|uniref:pilus assembly protein TadG-related protein n=1 Tax=Solimonas variicoloris TaxID=254408 RepID=UPI00036EFAEA|nr:pilus assembly protein TadG-related protein [Solimonas variicoloris]